MRTLGEMGELVGIGYRWDQDRMEDLVGFYTMAVMASLMGVLCVLKRETDTLILLAPFIAIPFGVLYGKLSRPRTVIFTREGDILTPNGIPRFLLPVRKLSYSHNAIASIELTTDCKGYGVMLFKKDGFCSLLAENMHKPDARAVAVQLTIALQELRDGMANASPSRVAYESDPWAE